MGKSEVVKVALAMASYKGPDVHCFSQHNEFLHYLGRLQERSSWAKGCTSLPSRLPHLDPYDTSGEAEWRPGDPEFRFFLTEETGNSLIGQARDRCVDNALGYGCDYVLFWDDDLVFSRSAFLKLWRHQLPVVSGLAFTARDPIAPVIYDFKRSFSFEKRSEEIDIAPVWNYAPDALNRVDATGTGLVLISTEVFEKVPRPWFHGAVNCGEDIHFCFQCMRAGVGIHCDTSVKTAHRPNLPDLWMDENRYKEMRAKHERQRENSHDSNPNLQQHYPAGGYAKELNGGM